MRRELIFPAAHLAARVFDHRINRLSSESSPDENTPAINFPETSLFAVFLLCAG